jgi:hypothetical protein
MTQHKRSYEIVTGRRYWFLCLRCGRSGPDSRTGAFATEDAEFHVCAESDLKAEDGK